MIANGIKGIETTQINPMTMLNCSDRGSVSDRKREK